MKMPSSAAADPTADPSADPTSDDSSGAPAEQGYTIEIIVAADGTITVDVEQGEDDDSESGAASGAGADDGSGDSGAGDDTDSGAGSPTPAKNIKDALSIALDIFRNNGQIAAASSPDDDMQSGYNG